MLSDLIDRQADDQMMLLFRKAQKIFGITVLRSVLDFDSWNKLHCLIGHFN